MAQNLGRTVVFATLSEAESEDVFAHFVPQIEARAGVSYEALSRREVQHHAVRIFFDTLWAHPKAMWGLMAKTFVKYLLVPVESLVQRLTN